MATAADGGGNGYGRRRGWGGDDRRSTAIAIYDDGSPRSVMVAEAADDRQLMANGGGPRSAMVAVDGRRLAINGRRSIVAAAAGG